jgi:hypothetical protein
MHETHPIEDDLRREAERISAKYGGAPTVVIVAGHKGLTVPRSMLGSSLHEGNRLRDLLGVLEAAKQIESLKHFFVGDFGRERRARMRAARKKGAGRKRS